jgi:DNA polymerase-3 subunit beta
VTVTAALLSGKFAPWRKVIPHRKGRTATIGAAALLQAVRQAEVVTSDDSRAVAFRFSPGRVSLAARSAEYGSAAVACPAAGAVLEAVLRLDPRHVRQWLATLDGAATVSFDPGDGTTAVLLRHEDAVAVVMPMVAGAEQFEEVGT